MHSYTLITPLVETFVKLDHDFGSNIRSCCLVHTASFKVLVEQNVSKAMSDKLQVYEIYSMICLRK